MWLLLWQACDPTDASSKGQDDTATGPVDQDADGYDVDVDCDNAESAVHPGADDTPYDGVDADCAGDSDFDIDGDGYDQGDGRRDDCDDGDPDVHPGADEHCDDVDEDCDGDIDDDPTDGATWFEDRDGDGFGGPFDSDLCGDPGAGWSADSTDCADGDAAIHPGAPEVACSGADEDCDGDYGAGGAIGADGTVYSFVPSAIAAAADGDTVTICEGVVAQSLTVDHPIVLEGYPGAEIAASGGGPALSLLADTTVRGLALSAGSGFADGGYTFGGLVYVDTGVHARLEDIEGSGGAATFGGCIAVALDGRLDLVDSRVVNCQDAQLGGVLYAANRASVSLDGVELGVGDAEVGGGVLYLGNNATADLVDSTLRDGDAELGGGAYLAAGAAVTADAATSVEGNNGKFGGGLFLSDASSWSGGTVSSNDASDMGGGVYVPDHETDVRVSDTTVQENDASWGGGFAVLGGVDLVDVDVVDNDGTTGGGFYVLDGGVTMEGGSCTGNDTSTFGGGASVWASQYAASFEVTRSDWGTGARDNDPEDVYAFSTNGGDHTEDGYGSDASFSCTGAAGC